MPHSHFSVHIKFCKLFKKAGALCLKAQAVYELVIRGIIMHLKFLFIMKFLCRKTGSSFVTRKEKNSADGHSKCDHDAIISQTKITIKIFFLNQR